VKIISRIVKEVFNFRHEDKGMLYDEFLTMLAKIKEINASALNLTLMPDTLLFDYN
jgi:hypothetical protein